MKLKIFLPIIFFSFILSGCKILNQHSTELPNYNSRSISNLIIKAINGDTLSNQKLGNFTDLSLPALNIYNSFSVDSIKAGKKKYYLALITFPNPIYNRFAIYDTALNQYLIDKSLNGYIIDTVIYINGKNLVKVSENFRTKNILTLNRMSLYQITDSSANLIFRSFTRLIEPKAEYSQEITDFSDDRIITNLSSNINSPISNKSDVFIFNYTKMEYISPNGIFDNFAKNEIENFKVKNEQPEIKDKNTYYASVGIDIGLDTIKTTGNTKDSKGYSLTLPDNNWKVLHDFAITGFVNKEFKGTRYLNEIIGASISVILIPSQDSAEMFENYHLDNITKGKYKVRYSDKVLFRKDFVQFFEFTCSDKKYILILQASKHTYDEFKTMYQGIINSFTIDC